MSPGRGIKESGIGGGNLRRTLSAVTRGSVQQLQEWSFGKR